MLMVWLADVVRSQRAKVEQVKREQQKVANRVAGSILTAAKLRYRKGRKVKTPQGKEAVVVEVFRVSGEVQVKVSRDALLLGVVVPIVETWATEGLEVVK